MLYYCFGAKQDLYREILRRKIDERAGFIESLPDDFAGAIARSHWPATGRAFFRAIGGRYGDHRNWPAIDAWADHIAAQLRQVKSGV